MLFRRRDIVGVGYAAACGCFPRAAKAQPVPVPLCIAVAPPVARRGIGPRFQPFTNEAGTRAEFTPFMADRLVREFRFTEFGLSLPEDRWTPADTGSSGGRVVLRVHFLQASPEEQDACMRGARDWLREGVEDYLGLEFGATARDAQIRVRFGDGGNWSFVGRQALDERDLAKPTMNILPGQPDYIVKHEFGHAFGLRHEHQHPDGGIRWRPNVVVAAMQQQKPPWTPEMTRRNILEPLDRTARCVADPDPNPSSVMMYDFPEEWTENHMSGRMGSAITARDRRCVLGIYSL